MIENYIINFLIIWMTAWLLGSIILFELQERLLLMRLKLWEYAYSINGISIENIKLRLSLYD
jgi:hypothetical protein